MVLPGSFSLGCSVLKNHPETLVLSLSELHGSPLPLECKKWRVGDKVILKLLSARSLASCKISIASAPFQFGLFFYSIVEHRRLTLNSQLLLSFGVADFMNPI